MKMFASALLMAGIDEKENNYQEAGLHLIARIPLIVASVFNHHAGWGETKYQGEYKGYIENFVSLLNLPHQKTEDLIHAMRLFNILHYDHGGGNLSTFVAKATASSLEDMYGSIASGILALEGPRHGRANQDCLEFVESIRKEVGDSADAEQVEACVRKRLEGGLVFGFGHAVLRVEDARASILYDFAAKKYPTHPLVKMALLLRKVGTKVLSENPKISDPYPNVDAISGIVLIAAGFPYPEYFPVLFGMSRVVGISRQIIYERVEARAGKGTPIVRPKYFYIGREDVSG
jgi:citrate synthase